MASHLGHFTAGIANPFLSFTPQPVWAEGIVKPPWMLSQVFTENLFACYWKKLIHAYSIDRWESATRDVVKLSAVRAGTGSHGLIESTRGRPKDFNLNTLSQWFHSTSETISANYLPRWLISAFKREFCWHMDCTSPPHITSHPSGLSRLDQGTAAADFGFATSRQTMWLSERR